MNIAKYIEKDAACSNGVSRLCLWANPMLRTRSLDSPRAEGKSTKCITARPDSKDSAIVAAATPYLIAISPTGFCLTKACRFEIDEAASSLRIQSLIRCRQKSISWNGRATQLEIEKQALKKEDDSNSRERLAVVGERIGRHS